jgi:thioredoxin 2
MTDSIIIRCEKCNTFNRIKKSINIYTKPVEADDASFNNLVLNSGTPLVVVDFYASWCGPCKMFAPVFDNFANTHTGEARAVKIDVDKNPGVVSRYQIQSMPTLLIFKNGKEVKRISGALSASQLESLIAPFIE